MAAAKEKTAEAKKTKANDATVRVSAEVEKLLGDFDYHRGKPRLPAQKFISWQKQLRASTEDSQRQSVELIALARRFAREGGTACAEAVAQLIALASETIAKKASASGWRK